MPRSDTYIEKEASINEQIDRMRHSATRSLLERDDVLIVASVSCIYGLGSVEAYSKMTLTLQKNYDYNREQIIKSLVALQYKRNDQNFYRGTFRARGEYLEAFPSHLEDRAWRLSLFGDKLEKIEEFDPLTGDQVRELNLILSLDYQSMDQILQFFLICLQINLVSKLYLPNEMEKFLNILHEL